MERMNHCMISGAVALAVALAAALMVALAGCTFDDLPMREGIEDLGYSWKQVGVARGDSADPAAVYGISVAISGNWAAVGCSQENVTATNHEGAVYLYQKSDGVWSRTSKLNGTVIHGGFGTSVALSGSLLLVGEPGVSPGKAYIYALNGGTWSLYRTFTPPGDAITPLAFGTTTALSDSWALIGDPWETGGSGAIYAYYKDDGGSDNWGAPTNAQRLVLSSRNTSDRFGSAIAVSGSTVVIGVPGAGEACIFYLNSGTWGAAGYPNSTLTEATSTLFGSAVSIYGDALVVGSPGNESAYAYTKSGTTWTGIRLYDPQSSSGDLFGSSVAISDSGTLICASKDDDSGADRGSLFPFGDPDTGWSGDARIIASDAEAYEQLGNAIAISGSDAIVAADAGGYGGESGTIVGAVYFFTRDR